MIIDEKEGEVFVRVFGDLLTANHGIREFSVDSLGQYINKLALPLLALIVKQNLTSFFFRDITIPSYFLHLRLVFTDHLLKDSQMFLMLKGHSSQQWVVVGRILVILIVPHKNSLHLLHVILLIHLEGAPIYNFLQCRLVRSREMLIVREEIINLIRELMAIFKARVVSAHQDDSQIDLLKADVYMKHILFGATRNTDWSPCLAISHRTQCHHKVKDHSHI